MNKRGIRLAVGAAAVTGALMGPELAPASGKEQLDSFDGSCSFEGTVGFSPPATNAQQTLSTWYDATGTCSGELNGRQVSNAPVKMNGGVHAVDGSCMHAQTTRPGRATITFADGTAIDSTFQFTYVLTEGTWSLRGERSGSAVAHASFVTDRTPSDVSEQCAGDGVKRIPMDVQLATQSPLVSGKGGGRSGDRPSKRNDAKRLHLTVRPRSVRVGRRTVFAFRVVTSAGRPASGAVVRLGTRRARAGRRGRVRIATTFRRRGRRVVRASLRGYRAARVVIRVRAR